MSNIIDSNHQQFEAILRISCCVSVILWKKASNERVIYIIIPNMDALGYK